MNRRQKIIVSVTSIFLVLLILLGLTYAYFLTQITGNTNPKSISVTTANLQLLYGDGNGVLEVGDRLTPGNPVNFKTQSGTTVNEKTFTVTNNGDAKIDSYGVTFEDLKVTYSNGFTDSNDNFVAGGTLTYFEFPNDFKITIKCTSNISGKTCNGYEGAMPSTNDILLKNSIEKDEVHSYTFALRYDETGIDQSADMNKTFQAKLDIINTVGTVDIEGTVTGHTTGDYVQVNSTPKKSYLNKDGKFKVVGLDIENHTVAIYNGTTAKSSTTLNVEKGESSTISNNTATVTDTDRKITININSTTGTYEVNKVGKDAVEGTPTYYAQIGELKVGDYVVYNYTPGIYTTTLVDDEGVSQSFNSANSDVIASDKWRVLSIDNDSVQIMPDIREVPKLTMYGAKGWINGEKVLNEMAEALYSGNYGTARSINIDDINKKVQHSGLHSYYLNNTLYSTNSKTLEELESETGVTIKDAYRTKPDGTSANGMKLDYYTYWLFTRDDTTSAEYNRAMIANPLTTSWKGTGQTVEFKLLAFYTFSVSDATSKFTDLLSVGETYTENDVSPYWLANRVADAALNSTNADNSYIKYGMRIMGTANASRAHMWNPKEGAQDKDAKPTYGVVPVVSLNNDLQIQKESGVWLINE